MWLVVGLLVGFLAGANWAAGIAQTQKQTLRKIVWALNTKACALEEKAGKARITQYEKYKNIRRKIAKN